MRLTSQESLISTVLSHVTGLGYGVRAATGDQRLLPFKDAERLTEVNRALDHIMPGGPFPYKKDGAIFRNNTGLLPQKPEGYYQEYTVDTAGAMNRGTRRIVQGQGGETYYTDDHYRSFIQIDPRRH
ncbi:MAG: ribonuclease N [Nitrospinae bacterium]|nr:ribonuclease N [Nitrospinota bacterium]